MQNVRHSKRIEESVTYDSYRSKCTLPIPLRCMKGKGGVSDPHVVPVAALVVNDGEMLGDIVEFVDPGRG